MSTLPPCHLCHGTLDEHSAFSELWRVSSDCRPFPSGGHIATCRDCSAIQKPVDPQWRADAAQIYSAYEIYHQSGGTEQAVFDPLSGAPRTRSSRLVDLLAKRTGEPRTGRLLDVGCGNGALLRAASIGMPGWRFAGLELTDKYRDEVLGIPRVDDFYVGQLDSVSRRFDVVTLIHALEHLSGPADFLREVIAPRLADMGTLLIEVPDIAQNPFDLLVADHATHFDTRTLVAVVAAAGFEVVSVTHEWIPKELTLLARHPRPTALATTPPGSAANGQAVLLQLLEIRQAARARRAEAAGSRPFGVFGTSIAATWVVSELGGQVDFFVDEDPARGSMPFMGRPVLRPQAVAPGASVVITLAPAVATRIARRLSRERPDVTWWSPASLSDVSP